MHSTVEPIASDIQSITRQTLPPTAKPPMSIHHSLLEASLQAELQPHLFQDYGPNGLQVEGRTQVQQLVTGVTASLALIEAAVQTDADAILVHHGLFWQGQEPTVRGWMKKRLQLLLTHNINLYAFHLPLDAHPTMGNNARLGDLLGFTADERRFGKQQLGWLGSCRKQTLEELNTHIAHTLGRATTCIGDAQQNIKTVAWCSGGAQSYFEAAIAAGADAFITGEISEPQAHYARECGVAFIACGHHASERYGVQAAGKWLAQKHGIAHQFIDIDNPA